MLEKIIKSKRKQTEKILLLAKEIIKDNKSITQLIKYFENAPDSEKGLCMEVIEFITKDNPECIEDHVDFVIANINYKAPRVKWESSRIIGNISKKYPNKTIEAIPSLLLNTKDNGTVVRWSAAFALTEIAINNLRHQKEIIEMFSSIVEQETNSGVKKVYIKALKK